MTRVQLQRTDEPLGILWLVLDEQSSERLQARIPGVHPNRYYHHCTLQYGIPRSEVSGLIGKPCRLEAYAVAQNDKAQAVRVTGESSLPDTYGVPHITLTTAQGILPFESVAMLQGDHTERPISPPLALTGTVEFELLSNL